ncbi:MAG: DUF2147 domain-containing protein [Bradyrhizobium sp.]
MKRLLAVAAVLLASSAAHAQYTFHYGGRTIRIDPDSGTVSIRRIHRHIYPKSTHARRPTPEQATVAPPAPVKAPAEVANEPPTAQPVTPAAQAPVAGAPAVATTNPPRQPATANNTPAENAALRPAPPTPPPAAAPTRQLQQAVIPKPAPRPAVAAVSPRAPAPVAPLAAAAAPVPAAVRNPNSPIGLWLTQEKKGKVRIEQCGASLCGYSVDLKSNQDGEQVLINMKPGNGLIWSGRILDPNTGSTYDSTIALMGAGGLRVQGCAFNGMFCGGQTWTRAN